MDKGEKRGYAHAQEELFNRMKDIERLKRMFPDSYEVPSFVGSVSNTGKTTIFISYRARLERERKRG